MATLNALGQKIRTLRTDRGLSQQQLADLMFVTRKTISNWESGNRMPDVAMLSCLAGVLHVKTHELLDVISGPVAPPVILIVEDDPAILKDLARTLGETLPGVQISGCRTGAEALDYAENTHVDLAFLDTELAGESGTVLAEQLLAVDPRISIIFHTGRLCFLKQLPPADV